MQSGALLKFLAVVAVGVPVLVADTFVPISQPTPTYETNTRVASIPLPPQSVSSVTAGVDSVTFSQPLRTGQVPTNWATWGLPPNTESSTPNVVECLDPSQGGSCDVDTSSTLTPLTMTFSTPVTIFGFEAEPDAIDITPLFVADFYRGATQVGEISQRVSSNSGALLFGASTDVGFTKVVFTPFAGDPQAPDKGYALAQIRLQPVPEPRTVGLLLVSTCINNS